MNNFQYGAPPQSGQYQIQQMFPQPQGSVYAIQTPLDIGNVPIGSTGLSVALCFPEQLMYIKSFQNGNPIIMAYRIAPFQKQDEQKIVTETSKGDKEILDRIANLEKQIQDLTNGGKFNGLL